MIFHSDIFGKIDNFIFIVLTTITMPAHLT